MPKFEGICRVLIVDDEILIRQGIKHYLNWESEGFQIVGEASNGQEALELIEITNPHIVITDIVMPIMNGDELTRVIKEKYPQIEIIILSSYAEFDYVRSSYQCGVVDYILKPKLDAQSLLKVLNVAVDRIPCFKSTTKKLSESQSITEIINKLALGYEAQLTTEQIKKAFPFSHFYLMGVDMRKHPSRNSAEYTQQFQREIKNKFVTNIKEAVPHSFTIDSHISVFLINLNQKDMTKAKEIVHQLAASHAECGFALTEEFQSFSDLGKILKNKLLKLLSYRFYFPDLLVLTEQSLPRSAPKSEKFNLEWFTEEFMQKNFTSALHYLRNYIEKLAESFTTDVFEYKSFVSNIIFNMTILLGNMNEDLKELEQSRYTYFKRIDEANSARETINLLNGFLKEANKSLLQVQKESGNINLKMFMEYLKNNYTEPLTLTDVAAKFHFNPSYVSSYFKAHNGEGFIDTLNRIRIEEACKLLLQDRVNIAEISDMVGFSDHSYFCKVFKKIKGLSPSQYKRKQLIR